MAARDEGLWERIGAPGDAGVLKGKSRTTCRCSRCGTTAVIREQDLRSGARRTHRGCGTQTITTRIGAKQEH